MAKKMVGLKVQMRCEKCKIKTFKIAAKTHGVTAMRWEEDQEKLVVEGYGVEVDELVQTLKKKVGYTQILFVHDI